MHPEPVPTRRLLVPLLTIVTAAMALAFAVSGGTVLYTVHGLRADLGRLKAERADLSAKQDQAQARLRDDFHAADLPGKLDRVRQATDTVRRVLLAWDGKTGGLHTVRDAEDKCEAAVFDYDAAAVRFPADMRAGLPDRIDMHDSATSCGRFD